MMSGKERIAKNKGGGDRTKGHLPSALTAPYEDVACTGEGESDRKIALRIRGRTVRGESYWESGVVALGVTVLTKTVPGEQAVSITENDVTNLSVGRSDGKYVSVCLEETLSVALAGVMSEWVLSTLPLPLPDPPASEFFGRRTPFLDGFGQPWT